MAIRKLFNDISPDNKLYLYEAQIFSLEEITILKLSISLNSPNSKYHGY